MPLDRLDRIEKHLEHVQQQNAEILAGQHYTNTALEAGERRFAAHEKRIEDVEGKCHATSTHLAWIKGIGTAVATALGGLHIFGKH